VEKEEEEEEGEEEVTFHMRYRQAKSDPTNI
jgi:hypothetical protein